MEGPQGREARADIAAVQRVGEAIRANVARVLVGKAEALDYFLVALLCEGHVLSEDVPGVGKTVLARAVAASTGCSFNRIQCTPDLLPSDVMGVSIFNPQRGAFEFRPGPVFAQIVLADEINRATPRTQSALLESMAERQVSLDGQTHPLPRPFMIVATQNPIEYEGTFPLPEAQLDRFFLRLRLGYPSFEEELAILERLQLAHPLDTLTAVVTPEALVAAQREVRAVYVEASVQAYVVRLVQATRQHPDVLLGASPRGTLALRAGAQALAALQGRDYVIPDDVKRLAEPILAHRLVLRPESELRRRGAHDVIADVLEQVPLQLEEEEVAG